MTKCSFVLSIFIAAGISPSLLSSAMTLVHDGQATCTIVIAPDASDHEKLAAEELSAYLGKMSGAKVPIGSDASVTGNRIRMGVFGRPPVQDWKGKRPVLDAFAMETRARDRGGTDLLLIGGDARGAAYAAYELLERFLDVRWYMPTEVGEEVPQRKTIELEDLKWSNQPDFVFINGLNWPGDGRAGPGAVEWLRHNKGAVGDISYMYGHSWSGYIEPSEANKKAHPEWFALNPDGTRSEQLCTSNPEVIQTFIKLTREFFDKNPNAVCTSISPNDGGGFCTCEHCRAIDKKYGVTDDSQTDRFIEFANTILKELKKTHPTKLVGILAYVSHTRPPVSAVPDENYATMICHTPWEFCHVHAINDPSCKPNTRFREMIEGWTKVCKHVSVYDYYGHFYMFTPWPIVHSILKDIPYLRNIGVTAFISETQQNWANQGLNFYVAAKLLWDTDLDQEAFLDDLMQGLYGPAAKPMRKYWEAWENAMTVQPCGGYGWVAMLQPELLRQTGLLLDQAEWLAGDDQKVRERIALHRAGYLYTDAYFRMRSHGDAGELGRTVAACQEAVRIIKANEKSHPQAFFTSLASDQTEIQMLQYKRKLEATTKPAKPNPQDSEDGPKPIFGGEEK
jgi:hypothetical protein